MKLTVDSLQFSADAAASAAEFNKPISPIILELLQNSGFSVAKGLARHCMGWIWRQWLLGGPESQIHDRVEAFVARGIEMQEVSSLTEWRGLADLFLLHCAIFASSQSQLKELAGRVVDASGNEPQRNGQLYATAWCGMLKHWILGDEKAALRQSELIWGAYRDPSFFAATKPLVSPWLAGDWKRFYKAQEKDFAKLWARGRKDGTVRSETADEIVVTVERYPIEQKWCWAHCGLALLVYRQGVEVATDPFWFPPHALKVAGSCQ